MSGPLDPLVDRGDEAVPRLPVHARVLDLITVDGRVRAFACWQDPGGAPALFRALQARVEGSLLGELSDTAHALVEADAEANAGGHALDVGPTALHLVMFDAVADVERAVAPFGFAAVPPGEPRLRPTLAALRHEWAALESDAALLAALPDRPTTAFVAPVRAPTDVLLGLERRLRREGVDDVWGNTPGAPFARLVAALPPQAPPLDAHDLGTLSRLEEALVPREPSVVRWMPPMVFQALCDAVGVVATQALGARVDWGLCEPDPQSGHAPPPVFRVVRDGSEAFLAIGLELLRWCVMPLAPGESPPPLADWVADVFSRP